MLTLERPRGARLRAIVRSHGWYALPPFRYERGVLHGATMLGERAVSFSIAETARTFSIDVDAKLTANERALLKATLAEMLSLHEPVHELYALTDGHERLGYARKASAGRMLRSASVWEDLVKVLLTTNCSWALTTKMTERLVESLGTKTSSGRRAFPTAKQMAAVDEAFYRDVVRAGYRAGHLHTLARAVDRGELVLPTRGGGDDEPLRKRLLALPGYGPYAADNLLRLLGRFGYLGLDSMCRARLIETYGGTMKTVDRKAHARYRSFGRWAGLAMWLDVTRAWHVPRT